MLAATAMSSLGDETIYPVRPHDVAIVEGGGGFIQHVPFNIPGFGGLGALTEDDKNKLAREVVSASVTFGDVRGILATIPTSNERSEVAIKAITLGGDVTRINQALAEIESEREFKNAFKLSKPLRIAWGVASTLSFAASVYHGYKRNDSVGWAIWWGFMGALFPIITPTIAIAQGFAKPKRAGFGAAKRYRRRR